MEFLLKTLPKKMPRIFNKNSKIARDMQPSVC